MHTHIWRLVATGSSPCRQDITADDHAIDTCSEGTGAAGPGASAATSSDPGLISGSPLLLASGQAGTAAAAIEEAFDAAELHVLTSQRPASFALQLLEQDVRVIPSPASIQLTLQMLADLRDALNAELVVRSTVHQFPAP